MKDSIEVIDAWLMGANRYMEQGTDGTDIKLFSRIGKRGGFDYVRFDGKTFAEARAKAADYIVANYPNE